MSRYDDIHPDHIDPETNRPYAGYSSPCIDPFADSAAMSRTDRAWNHWLKAADAALGLPADTDCDGDERFDGYSLDTAYEAFEEGISAADYAAGRRA